MQLDMMDAVHLRVARLWANYDVEPDQVEINHRDMTLTYHGEDVAELAENVRHLAIAWKWIGTSDGDGYVHADSRLVKLRLDHHMSEAGYDEGHTATAVRNQLSDLVATAQATEDDDTRDDAVERLGQAVEMLTDQVTYSDDDVVMFSRMKLLAQMARTLGVEEVTS